MGADLALKGSLEYHIEVAVGVEFELDTAIFFSLQLGENSHRFIVDEAHGSGAAGAGKRAVASWHRDRLERISMAF